MGERPNHPDQRRGHLLGDGRGVQGRVVSNPHKPEGLLGELEAILLEDGIATREQLRRQRRSLGLLLPGWRIDLVLRCGGAQGASTSWTGSCRPPESHEVKEARRLHQGGQPDGRQSGRSADQAAQALAAHAVRPAGQLSPGGDDPARAARQAQGAGLRRRGHLLFSDSPARCASRAEIRASPALSWTRA